MASSLASTSALTAPSIHQDRHFLEQAEEISSHVASPSRLRVDQELDSCAPLASMSSRVSATRRRNRTSMASRSSRLSAPLSLTSMVKTSLACLLLVLAIGSEPVKAQNVTNLSGTWTSGSGKVLTGLVSIQFCCFYHDGTHLRASYGAGSDVGLRLAEPRRASTESPAYPCLCFSPLPPTRISSTQLVRTSRCRHRAGSRTHLLRTCQREVISRRAHSRTPAIVSSRQ